MNLAATGHSNEWDYTHNAAYYQYRPNYAAAAIDRMLKAAEATTSSDYVVADVGAGTGNLTVLLLERKLTTIAVEPNASMRNVGIDRTKAMPVRWVVGTGESTTLPDQSINLFAMGSSFNTTERAKTLDEAFRVLKPTGWFACMWNNRDLESDSQRRVEEILRESFPDYSHGTRREDQTQILSDCPLFTGLQYIEESQEVDQPLDSYIAAWKSVKNRFWDLGTSEGKQFFDRFEKRMRAELPPTIRLNYRTKIWMARKRAV